jgi:hypothetical protein
MKINFLGITITNETENNTQKQQPPKEEKQNEKLTEFKRKQELEKEEYERNLAKHMINTRKEQNKNKNEILKHVKQASRGDYNKWLINFVENGGEPTHYYDYPFNRWRNFYVAIENFEIKPLYGASRINIIVPKGITITGNQGHTDLFYCDKLIATGTIPVFIDTI